MKISLKWLKNYIPIDLKPQELAHRLTMIGLEVESVVENQSGIQGIIVGEILDVENHPNADKLKICIVNTGDEELSVVCGAPNVEKGTLVPIAKIGAVLADGQKITPATIRGVPSEGMICSERELGLSEDHTGIVILDRNKYKLGELFSNSKKDRDIILDINVTPNRPDCLSLLGIAKEIGIFLDKEVILPDSMVEETKTQVESLADVKINDPDACPRYCARVIQDVRIGPSPEWLKNYLESVGIRSINNVVDVTNFVLMETGQPLHAFDYDLLQGHTIIVRKAKNGEKFTTLDEKEHKLHSDDLLICDGDRAVALAGIMGGLNSEVTKHTRHILLESAYFDSLTIRRSSNRMGLSTEASQRFERGADPNKTLFAINRTAKLLSEVAGGKVSKGVIDVYPKSLQEWKVSLRISRIEHVLGAKIPAQAVKSILAKLGLKIEGDDPLEITVPTSRYDLLNEIDFIEEIVRHYGFDKIEPKLHSTVALNMKRNKEQEFIELIRDVFVGIGFHETLNSSLVSEKHVTIFTPEVKPVVVQNPLSPENAYLRTTLISGLLDTMQWNLNRSIKNLRLFEIGKTFESKGKSLPKESLCISGILTGSTRLKPYWDEKEIQTKFYQLKGVIETILQKLHITSVSYKIASKEGFESDTFVHLAADDDIIGYMGEMNRSSLDGWDIEEAVYGFEIYIDSILGLTPAIIQYSTIPKFPSVKRDLAFVVDESTAVEKLKNGISVEGGRDLIEIDVFDLYRGKQIPVGKKSVAFSLTFLSPDNTLKEDEVDPVISRIIKFLGKEFNAELRS